MKAKHQPTPNAAISTPPSAGPITRPALKSDELSAIAFGSSSRPTSRKVKAWRFGASKTSAAPPQNASTKYGHTTSTPANASAASTAATTIELACVIITTRRLSNRSASTPEKRPKIMNGANRAKTRAPTYTGECVSERMSQGSAVSCIHVPITETSCPVKNRR